jgi:hypothetical protein
MSYRVKAFVAIAIFYGIQLALIHFSDPSFQRFMTQYWFSKHWYSPFLLSSLFFYLAIFFYVRHHQKRLMASKVS